MELQPIPNQSLHSQSKLRMEEEVSPYRFPSQSWFHLLSLILKPISSLLEDNPSLSLPLSLDLPLSQWSQDLFLQVFLLILQQESFQELPYLQRISSISLFKLIIKSDQLNSRSLSLFLFLYPIFIILNSLSLSSNINHSLSLLLSLEIILSSISLQEFSLLVSLSILRME